MRPTFSLLALTWLALASPAAAQLITFDQTPTGAAPVDDAVLATPYNLTGGGTVRFYFDNNLNNAYDAGMDAPPVFEAAGPEVNNGFSNDGLAVADTANFLYTAQLGSFFLRPFNPGVVPKPFFAEYATSQVITALSGEIWDIDGSATETERWRVDVLDSVGGVLATQLSPLGNTSALDGDPWTFAFTGLPAGVAKVRLTFIGTKQGGVGLAFNNFSPLNVVPEPSSWALMVLGIAGLGLMRRHRARS